MPAFTQPLWLFLPLLVPLAAGFAWWRAGGRGKRIGLLVAPRLRPTLLPPPGHGHGTATRLATRFLLLSFLAMALARPQWGRETTTESSSARDILLAIDTSRSMLATDAAPNRLEQAKLACLDLLNRLPGDRFGVLGFAGSAFPLAPVTSDHDAIRETINNIDTETLPLGGTDLAAAVEMSLQAFEEAGPRRRAMVILSDGEDLEGRLDGVAAKAKEKGVFIFAFAIGTERGSVIPLPGGTGGFVQDERGQPVVTRRATATLEKLAAESGGYAAVLAGQASLAAQLQEGLAKLDAFAKEEQARQQAAERFQWPLGAMLATLILCLWLRPRSRCKAPAVKPPAALLALFFLTAAPPHARAAAPPDPMAMVAGLHRDGKFKEAIPIEAQALLDCPPDQRAIVSANLGNSLYEVGRANLPGKGEPPDPKRMQETVRDWEDALAHLDHSLKLRPDHKATAQNRDTVKEALDKLREELKKQQDQQKQQQQKQDDKKDDKQKKDQKDQKDQKGQGQQDKNGQQQDKDQGKDQQPQDKDGKKDGQKDGAQQQGKDDKDKGKDGQPKDGKEQDGGAKPGDAKEGDLPDASTGDRKGEREARGTVPAQIGPDGRLVMPEEPAERAKVLEAIRRNLDQRSMENRKVNLIPKSNQAAPRKDW